MIHVKKDENIEELLQKIGEKEIGFVVTINKKEYLTCTCGQQEMHGVVLVDKEEKKKNGLECPCCHNRYILDEPDFEEDTIPIRFTSKTYRDDNWFVLGIGCQGIFIKNGILSTIKMDEDEWAFAYDKQNQKLYLIEDVWNEWWEYNDLRYENGYIYSEDVAVAQECEIGNIERGDFDSLYIYDVALTNSGLVDIIKLLSEKTGVSYDDAINDSSHGSYLSDIIAQIIVSTNVKWQQDMDHLKIETDYKLKDLCITTNIEDIKEFTEAGVNMNASTVEEAFGMPVKYLDRLSIQGYIAFKKDYDCIMEQNLPEIMVEWISDIPREEWKAIISFSKEMGCSIAQAITYFHRSITNGMNIYVVRNVVFEMIKSNRKDLINAEQSFTSKTKRRWDMIKNKIMTSEEYDELAKKPTLNTIMNIIKK